MIANAASAAISTTSEDGSGTATKVSPSGAVSAFGDGVDEGIVAALAGDAMKGASVASGDAGGDASGEGWVTRLDPVGVLLVEVRVPVVAAGMLNPNGNGDATGTTAEGEGFCDAATGWTPATPGASITPGTGTASMPETIASGAARHTVSSQTCG